MLLLKGGQREGDKERWMHGEKMLTDIDCGALLHLSAKGVDLHQRPAILTGPWYQSLPDFDFVSESPLVLLLDWIDLSVLTFA